MCVMCHENVVAVPLRKKRWTLQNSKVVNTIRSYFCIFVSSDQQRGLRKLQAKCIMDTEVFLPVWENWTPQHFSSVFSTRVAPIFKYYWKLILPAMKYPFNWIRMSEWDRVFTVQSSNSFSQCSLVDWSMTTWAWPPSQTTSIVCTTVASYSGNGLRGINNTSAHF